MKSICRICFCVFVGVIALSSEARAKDSIFIDLALGTVPEDIVATLDSQYGIVLGTNTDDLNTNLFCRGQDNIVQDGVLYNLCRVRFESPPRCVTLRLIDSNTQPQKHSLLAFDADGNEVSRKSFRRDRDLYEKPFDLTVCVAPDAAMFVSDVKGPKAPQDDSITLL